MPKFMHVCAESGCPELVPRGYCTEHRKPRGGSPGQRMGGWRRSAVKRVLIRENPRCAVEGCEHLDLEMDHVVPLSQGGTNDRSNLRLLCREHHRRASRNAANDPGT